MQRLLSVLIFGACLLQSLETGTFLTLDVTTKALQMRWGFDLSYMVLIGNIGYSLGFLGVGLFNLVTHFPIWVNILIAGFETSLSWFLIWIFLCPNCVEWYWVIFFEAGIGMGTAIGYTASVQIASRDPEKTTKSWKLVLLALMVSVGSVVAFTIFVEVSSLDLVIVIMFLLSLSATGLIFFAALVPVSEEMVTINSETTTLVNPVAKLRVNFSVPFGFYLFALNLTFGIIMTFINSASSILSTFGRSWSLQRILVVFMLGNLCGRILSLWLKNYLQKILWLFALFACLIGIFQALLIPFWNVGLILTILILSSFFFGLIWSTTTLLAREFFSIEEKRSLGLVFFGMAAGPPIFGLLASWLYSFHESNGCTQICFEIYLILASFASFLAVAAYLASWYLVWVRS